MEQTNISWRTKYATAFMSNGKMVIRYRFPFSRQKEAALLGAYHLHPDDRLSYYQTLSAMLERNFLFTECLQDEAVPSVLYFESVCQTQEDNAISVYCTLSEPVVPLTQSLFAANCNALTAFNVFLRLAHILRDIHKIDLAPTLRYLDMEDVYLTDNNKILLGGFFYAVADDIPEIIPFLPDAAPVVPEEVYKGQRGDAGTDMQTLCKIAWNIFSGLPWNCHQTEASLRIPPRYAPSPLLDVLEFGLAGNPDNFNAFRKKMLQCHKLLSKTEFADTIIPMAPAHKKEYLFAADLDATT